ncbi:MAG: HAD family phosphatase [Clostridia bacterium]|nr:HAD family phosphatase [Clostridia bacterium]
MKPFTHAIFDFDGTIADSQWAWLEIHPRFFQMHGYEVTEADYAACQGLSSSEKLAYFRKKFSLPSDYAPTFDDYTEVIAAYYRTENVLKPGVKEFLDHLKRQGIPCSVFSATRSDAVKEGLAVLGVDSYFDHVFSTRDIGIGKNNPDSFRYCCQRMGVSPESCLMVEDFLPSIKTAKSLGMTVYAIYEKCFDSDRDQIKSLADRYAKESMIEFLK